MGKYEPQKIESKWQKIWGETKLNQVDLDKSKKPFYNLMMFPYPSAEGLHVGNMYAFVHSDAYGRFMRLKGFDVFEPIGLDGFGIHSENYALKMGEHILDVSKRTEKHFYEQLHLIGNQYDWQRILETYKPEYYKWTQWIFVQMFKKGLAYRAESYVNWCFSCQTVLSDEQVISGRCERCDSLVEKKMMKQWFFKITDYAERLLKNLDWIKWSERTKLAQRNWIGKSEGSIIKFKIVVNATPASGHPSLSEEGKGEVLEVFTTRLDTIFGCTYCVLAPEHEIISKIKNQISNINEVEGYIEKSRKKSEIERVAEEKEKTGVELKEIRAVNPFNNQEIPVFVADYVLSHYGTGAVMAVPAHDERDFEFAKKYGLEIIEVIKSKDGKSSIQKEAFLEDGILSNSREYDHMTSEEARRKMNEWLEKNNLGGKKVNYKLRDWCISRQRYWGPPIPMIWCGNCAKNKPRFLFLHSYRAHSKMDFWPWLKDKVEKSGFEVFAPDLPGGEESKLEEQIKFVLDDYSFDEQTIIVTHSLGGVLAMKLLESGKIKARKLVMVAPPLNTNFKDNKKRPALDKYCDWKFNFKKIKKNVREIAVLADLNDYIVPAEHTNKISKELGANLIEVVAPSPHFDCEESQVILDNVLIPEYSNLGWQPVSEKDLPVLLPETKDYLPQADGLAPLARNEKFWKIECPKCGGPARRETDVSDTFLDSAWYFLRYPSVGAKNSELEIGPPSAEPRRGRGNWKLEIPWNQEITRRWLPVDMYIGGHEHAVLHLLYSRFITMFFNDLGLIDFEEPYKRFFAHGLLISEGAKMSKSRGNIINPDEYIAKYGADAVRMYLMFLGDVRQGGDWRDEGMAGMYRFANRVWTIAEDVLKKNEKKSCNDLVKEANKTIKRVEDDLIQLKFNTAISFLMVYVNYLKIFYSEGKIIGLDLIEILAKLLAPFAPHMAEELWSQLGHKKSIFTEKWPEYDPALIKDETIELVVQINGKVRARLSVPADISEEEAKNLATCHVAIKKWLAGKEPKKVIFVEGKLLNIVI